MRFVYFVDELFGLMQLDLEINILHRALLVNLIHLFFLIVINFHLFAHLFYFYLFFTKQDIAHVMLSVSVIESYIHSVEIELSSHQPW